METKISNLVSIKDVEYGIHYDRDPLTGELIGRPMTREEVLESDRKFSEAFEPDFTGKAWKESWKVRTTPGHQRKSQP